MKVLNFGSINIDYVYRVPHILRNGETLQSRSLSIHAGGKGNNQSMALAKAGAPVYHAGMTGPEAGWILKKMDKAGVETGLILMSRGPSGHAVIQVSDDGQNSIVLHGGANRQIPQSHIRRTVRHFHKGDMILLQNEVNSVPVLMALAKQAGMQIIFNPAPFGQEVMDYPLHLVDYLVFNEVEGMELAGQKKESRIMPELIRKYPEAKLILTRGSKGAVYRDSMREISVKAHKVRAIDTTAAGDTFIGYFVASLIRGCPMKSCLAYACKAASISVTRKGASDSIPSAREVFR